MTTATPCSPDAFVAAMGNAATGVTVVTTDGPAGRFAQTVSAMCSVSADPPSVLACVHRRSLLVAAACRNGVFAVNVLSVRQAHVSDTFAGRPASGLPYDFGCAAWRPLATGAPVLDGASAVFDCRLTHTTDAGTHRVLFGTVLASDVSTEAPLLYHARTYGAHLPAHHEGMSAP